MDLRNYRLQALQAELAQHPELAYDLTTLVSQRMDFNLADYWTPGKDDYLARLKKAKLLQPAEPTTIGTAPRKT